MDELEAIKAELAELQKQITPLLKRKTELEERQAELKTGHYVGEDAVFVDEHGKETRAQVVKLRKWGWPVVRLYTKS